MMSQDQENVISLDGMYQDYFLDYASYVILERAVPAIEDGLKPVQRRILHTLKQVDDGRYHKVANVIGQTMQYHPHGDAAIGDALVNLGQKELLIDTQGNWGDINTGASAAAARYIEARLTKFALEVAFNKQTTEWQLSYDGRKNEPIALPMKFPLLLALGVEGIAVGLSTKILPHNFIELIKGSIKILQGKKVTIYPDFLTGGSIDVSDYNGGKRGSRVKVRAVIEKADKNMLLVKELPYGETSTSIIESILKANDKGKIKIKKVADNTSKEVEIAIELPSNESPDVAIDALYAFTNCEVSIAPNACVIIDDKPHFMTVEEILEISTYHTKDLLRQELEIKKHELEEKLHLASLEKIFIEKRIYRDIEVAESFEEVLSIIHEGLRKYVQKPSDVLPNDKRLKLMRDITDEDLVKLTEIRIKRISKYNTFKADELIANLNEELKQVQYDLDHLTDFAIAYFERLLEKYGKGKERRTKITTFDQIKITQVVANNAKLYANLKEGFIGKSLKKETFISECSDIDDIIVFRADGKFLVKRISDKDFVGKNLLHVAVWKKGDDRTTYNLLYVDGESGRTMAKRFHVKAITRDREYDLTKGTKGSKILYFTSNPNGESETLKVQLSQGCSARIKNFEFDFSEIAIKGRSSQGNIVTKYPIKKVEQTAVGKSTLGALQVWMDEVSGKLNTENRGVLLGDFDTGDTIIALFKSGSYEILELDLNRRFDTNDLLEIAKFTEDMIISAVYYEGERKATFIKRFNVETTSTGQAFSFITESNSSKLLFATLKSEVTVQYNVRPKSGKKLSGSVDLDDFIDVKGWKALGNKLSNYKITSVKPLFPEPKEVPSTNEDESEMPKENKPKDDNQRSLF
ncbi:MAG: DNA gyrase/topoisomerase IV subunit A [Bacteroidota bacterium]